MTKEEIVKGLRIHLDTNVDCDNCPGKNLPICFEMLVMEAIRLLEKKEGNITEDERPHGKWIKIFSNPFTNGYICSVCGHRIQVTEQFLPKVTECEGCGADMR